MASGPLKEFGAVRTSCPAPALVRVAVLSPLTAPAQVTTAFAAVTSSAPPALASARVRLVDTLEPVYDREPPSQVSALPAPIAHAVPPSARLATLRMPPLMAVEPRKPWDPVTVRVPVPSLIRLAPPAMVPLPARLKAVPSTELLTVRDVGWTSPVMVTERLLMPARSTKATLSPLKNTSDELAVEVLSQFASPAARLQMPVPELPVQVRLALLPSDTVRVSALAMAVMLGVMVWRLAAVEIPEKLTLLRLPVIEEACANT